MLSPFTLAASGKGVDVRVGVMVGVSVGPMEIPPGQPVHEQAASKPIAKRAQKWAVFIAEYPDPVRIKAK
jgi:hypothetical protein